MSVLAPIKKPMPPGGNCWKVVELQTGVVLLMRLVSLYMVMSVQPVLVLAWATKRQVGRTNPLADSLRALGRWPPTEWRYGRRRWPRR